MKFFSPYSPDFLKKEAAVHGFELLIFCMSITSYSNAPSVTYFIDVSCKLKSDSINVMKTNALNFCKICGF